MLQIIPKGRTLASLSALILMGMWSNAIAAVFCPHMSGSSDCCLMQILHPHSHVSASNAQMSMAHMDHMQMSDMQDMSADMSEMQMDNATSLPENDSVNNKVFQVEPELQTNSESITLPNEPCSHCMMHSQSGAGFPLRPAVQNSTSYQVVAADTTARIVNTAPLALTFLDLHDHGPPGSSSNLYVLVSVFRI